MNEPLLNKDKVILDLCGGTGSWSKPYVSAGYDVYNISWPSDDVNSKTTQEFCLDTKPYGILAAPPCTEFSLAKTHGEKDFEAGMVVVKSCLEIIWKCRIDQKLSFWCLENPMGILRQFLGLPALNFQPWHYGNNYTKNTDLWGYFHIPTKNVVDVNQIEMPSIANLERSPEKRAVTPPGFANAFFKANQ